MTRCLRISSTEDEQQGVVRHRCHGEEPRQERGETTTLELQWGDKSAGVDGDAASRLGDAESISPREYTERRGRAPTTGVEGMATDRDRANGFGPTLDGMFAASGEDDPRVPSLRLAGAAANGRGGFEAWRELVSPVFVTDTDHELDRFDIDFHAAHLGPLILASTASVGQRFDRDTATVARSGVDHVIVQAYVDGRTMVRRGAAEIEVVAGDVWLFDLSRTLATATTPRFHNVSLTVPRSLLEPLVTDVDGLHGLKLGGDTPLGGLLSQHIVGLARRSPDMSQREATSIVDATVRLVAGCVGPALEAREQIGEAMASALLTRLRKTIDLHLADPDLGPEFLMRRHGLSRARLYRLFEPIGGVADYIRRRRLRRAFLDLAAPALRDEKVAAIGQRWGFLNEATFSRAFKARFGASPSEVRAGARVGAQSDLDEARLLRHWMRDLMDR